MASFTYDQSSAANLGIGRRTGMIEASGSTSWEYDARGRVIHERKHVLDGVNDLGTYNTYWTYYANGSVHQMVYPNQEAVTYDYDASGRLERVSSIQDGTYTYRDYVSTIAYDESGRVVRRELGNGVAQNYTFHPWTTQGGRLNNLTTSGAQTYQNLTYTYDDNGNIGSITDAVANETLNFTYDALNRLDTAGGAYSEDPAYDAETGNIASRNGIAYSYDPAHIHAVASTSNGNSYVYDNNGNVKTRNVSGQSFTLAYNKENRLIGISGGGSNARYVYDGDGNRVVSVEDGVTTIYIGNYFEAELRTGTIYPVFVPDLLQDELPYKLYLPVISNSSGTGGGAPQVGPGFYLTHPITPNQSTITWRMYYYAGGTRVAMRVAEMPAFEPQPTPTPQPYPAPTPTQSAYQENILDRFVAFLKDLFDVKAVSAAPLTVDAPVGEVYFLLGDHLGSTTITLNLDGSVKSEVRYSAWGETRYTTGTTPTERHYTGQIEESGFGLYFYNARWYDSALGRFIQADTIIPQPGSPQGWDRYSYTNSNPIRYSDSTGHCIDGVTTFLCIAMAAGAVAGYAVQVGENLDQGMSLGKALTTNISAEKILGGAVIAGGVIVGAAAVSVGLAAIGVTAIGAVQAANNACGGDYCSSEMSDSNLRFTQTTASPFFSEEGRFAGETIGSVSDKIRNGLIYIVDVPVNYIERGGYKLIENTRSALALLRSGTSIENWNFVIKRGIY